MVAERFCGLVAVVLCVAVVPIAAIHMVVNLGGHPAALFPKEVTEMLLDACLVEHGTDAVVEERKGTLH